jgi:hypothetical protein
MAEIHERGPIWSSHECYQELTSLMLPAKAGRACDRKGRSFDKAGTIHDLQGASQLRRLEMAAHEQSGVRIG